MNLMKINPITKFKKAYKEANSDGRKQIRRMILWALLVIPTLLWWKDSVLWVAFMSLYANYHIHHEGYLTSKAKQAAEDN